MKFLHFDESWPPSGLALLRSHEILKYTSASMWHLVISSSGGKKDAVPVRATERMYVMMIMMYTHMYVSLCPEALPTVHV